jgi:hypothetical protein
LLLALWVRYCAFGFPSTSFTKISLQCGLNVTIVLLVE